MPRFAHGPDEKPRAKPLTFRVPATTARELPEGRGFLRVVRGTPTPQSPAPTITVAAPVAATPAAQPEPEVNGQPLRVEAACLQ